MASLPVAADAAYRTKTGPIGKAPNGKTLYADFYRSKATPAASATAIVLAHGGGLTSGHRSSMASFAGRLADRGVVAITADYRLTNHRLVAMYGFEPYVRDAQHDLQAAVRYVRAHAGTLGVDPARIFVGGNSSGGYVALRAALRSEDPGASGTPGISSKVAGATATAGGAACYTGMGATKGRFDGCTPAFDPADPPLLLQHGTRDVSVPMSWVEGTCSAARASGIDCTLRPYEPLGRYRYWGGDHYLLAARSLTLAAEQANWMAAQPSVQ